MPTEPSRIRFAVSITMTSSPQGNKYEWLVEGVKTGTEIYYSTAVEHVIKSVRQRLEESNPFRKQPFKI